MYSKGPARAGHFRDSHISDRDTGLTPSGEVSVGVMDSSESLGLPVLCLRDTGI